MFTHNEENETKTFGTSQGALLIYYQVLSSVKISSTKLYCLYIISGLESVPQLHKNFSCL